MVVLPVGWDRALEVPIQLLGIESHAREQEQKLKLSLQLRPPKMLMK